MPKVAALVAAGGVGTRFGARTPKQFLRLGTMPILAATVHHFAHHPAVRAAVEEGAAICALPITETVKRVRAERVEATLDRSELWAVQTPQAFRVDLLREAHEKARRDGVVGTDDAMLVERLGHPVRVVRGLAENVKITTPEDLRRARALAGR